MEPDPGHDPARSSRSGRPERSRSILAAAGATLGVVACVVSALFVLGVLLPGVPGLGLASIGSPYIAWVLILAVVGLVLAGLGYRRNRSLVRRGIVVVAALSLVGVLVIGGQILSAAWSHGVAVNPVALFDASVVGSGPDETARYAGDSSDISIWRPSKDAAAPPAPVALFVHGGGWISGSRLDNSAHQRWFADRGWLVLSADYPLSSADRHLWDSTESQIGCAMAWTQQHAASYGGDISRFVMLGDSAGGNLVINTSYRANQGTLTSSCGGTLPHVDAVSVLYPAVDPAGFHDDPDVLLGSVARNMTEQYTGGTPGQYADRYRAITSTEYINSAAPPTLVIVGENDHLVPPQGAYTFFDRASEAGVDIQLIRVPYSDHVMDRAAGSIGSQLFRQVSQAWLTEHTRTPT